jgi:hypothetical protein
MAKAILMLLIVATTTVAKSPSMVFIEDRVDAIEINHVFDADVELRFEQFVFWRNEYVQAWRMIEHPRDSVDSGLRKKWRKRWVAKNKTKRNPRPEPPAFIPDYVGARPRRVGNEWVLVFHDRGKLRRVRASVVHETWTFNDPEVDDRERWGQDWATFRGDLSGGRR